MIGPLIRVLWPVGRAASKAIVNKAEEELDKMPVVSNIFDGILAVIGRTLIIFIFIFYAFIFIIGPLGLYLLHEIIQYLFK